MKDIMGTPARKGFGLNLPCLISSTPTDMSICEVFKFSLGLNPETRGPELIQIQNVLS